MIFKSALNESSLSIGRVKWLYSYSHGMNGPRWFSEPINVSMTLGVPDVETIAISIDQRISSIVKKNSCAEL